VIRKTVAHAVCGPTTHEKLTQRRQDAETARRTQQSFAPFAPLREANRAIFRAGAHAGRGATARENVIARSVVCDEAISFVDGEIASQTALAMTGGGDFQNRPLWIDSRNNGPSLLTDGIASFSLIWRLSEQIQESS
jgi:hypothetical protein